MSRTNNSKVSIEQPENSLGMRAVIPGAEGIDYEAIERAEKAMSELSANFETWMSDEIKALGRARDGVAVNGPDKETIEILFHTAHDIKGQAATLGFPLAGPVAASLCKLAMEAPKPERIPQFLIDQHVDSIKAIVGENVRDTENHTACDLTQRLTFVTNDFLAQEKKRFNPPQTDKTDTDQADPDS